jgi:hemerythrin-like domain-containing protein
MTIQIGGQRDAGFDEPLRLLSDCHRRIERFLDILLRVTRASNGGKLDEESRRALVTALRYFREAAPKHAADEEDSLFPRMRSKPAGQDASLMAVVARLESDHEVVREGHDQVEQLGNRWLEQNALPEAEVRKLVDHLENLQRAYAEHINIEDTHVFPAAGRMLEPAELAEIGREMASRRGLIV